MMNNGKIQSSERLIEIGEVSRPSERKETE